MKINPNTDTFRFCPGCGAPALKAAGLKSFACPACGFSFFINCAAAAMALIPDERGRLLVTTRKFDPGQGGLDIPGGFAEPGEGIEETLIREIKEELNLRVTALTYFCSCFNAYPYGSVTYPVTDIAFICRVEGFSTLAPGDDVATVRFVAAADLAPDAFALASARQVIARFKALGPDAHPCR